MHGPQNVKNKSLCRTIQGIEDSICQIKCVFQYLYVKISAGCVLIHTCVFDPTGRHIEMQDGRWHWHIRYLLQNFFLTYTFCYNVIIVLEKKKPVCIRVLAFFCLVC